MKHNILLLAAVSLIMINTGCKKSAAAEDADNCTKISEVRITGAKSTYYVGDTISLGTNLVPPISLFTWSRGSSSNFNSNDPSIFIYPCTKADEGWYYLDVSYPDCNDDNDSVYISVINRAVTPPCTPTTNTVTFSAMPDISFTTSLGIDASYNCKDLKADDTPEGYPDFDVYFSPYWNNTEPEDGEYSISSTLTFDDGNPYEVYIASTYESVYFQSQPGTVYVTHTNGKLTVTFCNLTLSGDLGGSLFTSTAQGNLTAP
jgi:hypothetical protein